MERKDFFPIDLKSSQDAISWSNAHIADDFEYQSTIATERDDNNQMYVFIQGMSYLHQLAGTVKSLDHYKKGALFSLKAVSSQFERLTSTQLPPLKNALGGFFNHLIDIDNEDRDNNATLIIMLQTQTLFQTEKRFKDNDEFGPMDLYEALISNKVNNVVSEILLGSFQENSDRFFREYSNSQVGLAKSIFCSNFSPPRFKRSL